MDGAAMAPFQTRGPRPLDRRRSFSRRRKSCWATASMVSTPAVSPRSAPVEQAVGAVRSEEHTSELQSLMRISYAVFCLQKKTNNSLLRNTSDYHTQIYHM